MNIEPRGLAPVGKYLFSATVILIIGYIMYLGIRDELQEWFGERKAAKAEMMLKAHPTSTEIRAPVLSVYIRLQPGEWSERVNIMENIMHVWPASAEVEYECEDVDGKITIRPGASKPGVHIWGDLTKYQRVRSKDREIVYSVVKR